MGGADTEGRDQGVAKVGGLGRQLRPGYQEGRTLGWLNPSSRLRRVQREEGAGPRTQAQEGGEKRAAARGRDQGGQGRGIRSKMQASVLRKL